MLQYIFFAFACIITTNTASARCDREKTQGDAIRCLEVLIDKANKTLISQQSTIASLYIPKEAIVAFELDNCPAGWEPYRKAYGRFIRGIDKSDKKIDPDGIREPGSFQSDAFKDHTHTIRNVGVLASGLGNFGGAHSPWLSSANNITTGDAVGETGPETRPKNVSLLYCKKQ